VAGLRQLHKADPIGRGYTVVGFGSQCVPQMLALALSIHDDAAALNARSAGGAGSGGGVRWRVRVGMARGSIVTGGLGARRQRCHFFGGAVAEAVRLARECPAGETRVQRGLSKAEGAQAFAFTHTLAGASGAGAVVGLTGRRHFSFGGAVAGPGGAAAR
jgi:class 3 adenylate cyclase